MASRCVGSGCFALDSMLPGNVHRRIDLRMRMRMRMRRLKWYETLALAGAVLIGVSAAECGDSGGSDFKRALPDGVVTSNTKADPSCDTCVQRKVCVKPDVGGGNACSEGWLPEQVSGCTRGKHWPNCRR